MANSFASGFSKASAQSQRSDILRNSAFANHATVTNGGTRKRPMYFVRDSTGFVASNPNSLRDMGPARNCEYRLDDDMHELGSNSQVTWRDIYRSDEKLCMHIS